MNSFRKIFPICALLALAGCAIGPDYKAPQATLPDSWRGIAAAAPEAADLARWWTRFDDAVLNALMERAFAGNLDLATMRERVVQSRAELGMTQSGLFPSADADGGYEMSQGGAQMFNAGLSASWELDIFGGTRRETEAAVADYRAALADRCAARVALSAEVARTYFLYRCLQEEIEITRNNLEAQKKSCEITRARKAGGFDSLLDVVRAEAQVKSTESEIPTLETELVQARHALEYLLGVPTGALETELAASVPVPESERFVPEAGVPAALLKRRPDILVAAYKLHAATARVGVAQSDFLPRFFITGDIGYRSRLSSDLFTKQSRSWSFGPSATWNLFSAGKTYHNVQLQNAATREAGLSWQDAVLTAVKEVEDALVAIDRERVRIKTLDGLVVSNRRAFELSRTLYTEGEIAFLDLLDAQRSVLTSEQKQVLSRKQLIVYAVDLYAALGGGWSEADMTLPAQTTDAAQAESSESSASHS